MPILAVEVIRMDTTTAATSGSVPGAPWDGVPIGHEVRNRAMAVIGGAREAVI
ncbi:hypothetical protein [Streptomyces sp. NPDC085479]|uniref:hypothetical protein n=1 Tax=Streptomyces sp. NPDC085479 TaxID=3365726 RepID=UPI0037D1F08B